MPTLDILICSIVHRGEMLSALLAELNRQLCISPVEVTTVDDAYRQYVPNEDGYRTNVRVICYRDNLQMPYGLKIGEMQASSRAGYVCCVDDDDWVAHDYIDRITAALAEEPDYVGFPISYTVDGHPSVPVHHSLRYGCWENREGIIVRDISEKNPIRRELAIQAHWEGTFGAEERWAKRIRALGQVITEVWIEDPMYFYRFNSSDHFQTHRDPAAGWGPPPSYPWLTVLGEP